MLKHPKLHIVFNVGPQQYSVEWGNHLPQRATYAVFDVPQDMVGPFGCQATLLTHIQLVIKPDSQISFHKAAPQPHTPQFVHITGVISSQVENPALAVVKFVWLVMAQLSSLPLREITVPLNLVCE